MTPAQFCHLLEGYAQISIRPPSAQEWKVIKEKLESVQYGPSLETVKEVPTCPIGGLG